MVVLENVAMVAVAHARADAMLIIARVPVGPSVLLAVAPIVEQIVPVLAYMTVEAIVLADVERLVLANVTLPAL